MIAAMHHVACLRQLTLRQVRILYLRHMYPRNDVQEYYQADGKREKRYQATYMPEDMVARIMGLSRWQVQREIKAARRTVREA